jgi:ABC-type amino acid transport substrate-binding protein
MTQHTVRAVRARLLLAVAALWQGPAAAQAAPSVRIATNVERSYFPPAEALLRKAYASLNLDVEYLPLPLPRAQVELRSGRIDAVAMRSETYFEQMPILRRVEVPLLQLQLFAYGKPPCPRSITLDELSRLRVSLQRGMAAAEAVVPESARVPANTPADAFLSVSTGAADYAVMLTTPWMVEVPVETRHGALCVVPTPILRTTLYHGVHESHAAWVPALEQALRGMRDRGEIQQAWTDYEREIATPNMRLQAQPGRSLVLSPSPAATPASAPARPRQ